MFHDGNSLFHSYKILEIRYPDSTGYFCPSQIDQQIMVAWWIKGMGHFSGGFLPSNWGYLRSAEIWIRTGLCGRLNLTPLTARPPWCPDANQKGICVWDRVNWWLCYFLLVARHNSILWLIFGTHDVIIWHRT